MLSIVLALQGCFDPVYPQLDREARVMEALTARDSVVGPPSPLSATEAVEYALRNNLDARVSEIEIAYQNEAAVAAKRRLLPSLTLRYSMDHSNHPSARWSPSTRSGNQSLESSYSSDPNSRQGEVGMMWSVIDFGVGYFRARQHGERIRYSELQRRRVRQQVVLDVLLNYWRTSAAVAIAEEAEQLKRELDEQAAAIRDSVEMRILSGAEGARRELAVHGGLAELEQWRRVATQAKMELARVMGCGNALGFTLEKFPEGAPKLPPMVTGDPSALQAAALKRRPELFQYDSQERVAVDEARIALLQMAPNANLSMSMYDDPDKFLEWSNWMTVGARVSWNLLNIPAKLTERRMAKLQGELARRKGLALAAGIMAQVGIAYSDWCLSHRYADTLAVRAAARQRLVDALAAGEKDGQTRPGEVLQERVRLLSEKAAAMRAAAEARVAGARLANAIGIEVDDQGRFRWELDEGASDLPEEGGVDIRDRNEILVAEERAKSQLPRDLSGLRVIRAEDFLASDDYFGDEWADMPAPAEPKPADSGEKSKDKPSDAGAAKKADPKSAKDKSAKSEKPGASSGKGGDESKKSDSSAKKNPSAAAKKDGSDAKKPDSGQTKGKGDVNAPASKKPAGNIPDKKTLPPVDSEKTAPRQEPLKEGGVRPEPGKEQEKSAVPEKSARARNSSGPVSITDLIENGAMGASQSETAPSGGSLRPPASDDVWRAISESYATASPAALMPKAGEGKRENGVASSQQSADAPIAGAVPRNDRSHEPYQSMRPPEGSIATVRQVPRTSFIPNPVHEEAPPEASRKSLLPPRPYAFEDIPPELDARRLERQRALEPLEAIPQNKPLRPPGEGPVAWPTPLSE